jgi:hypothetical protein
VNKRRTRTLYTLIESVMVPAAACLRNTNAAKEIMMMMAARYIDSDFVYCPKVQVN